MNETNLDTFDKIRTEFDITLNNLRTRPVLLTVDTETFNKLKEELSSTDWKSASDWKLDTLQNNRLKVLGMDIIITEDVEGFKIV